MNVREAALEEGRRQREEAQRLKRAEALRHEQALADAAQMTREIEERMRELSEILGDGLEVDHAVSFDRLRVVDVPGPPPPTGLSDPLPPPELHDVPRRPGVVASLVSGVRTRFERRREELEAENAQLTADWRQQEDERLAALEEHNRYHTRLRDEALAEKRKRQVEVDELRAGWQGGEPGAVAEYARLASLANPLPEGFILRPRFRFDEAANTLVGQVDLPDVDIIPEFKAYRYVKARSATEPINKVKETERNTLYRRIISSLVLRTADAVFSTDVHEHVPMLVVNGVVDGVDKATGRDVREVLVSFSMTRAQYDELDLARVEPAETLKWLKAKVSPKPHTFAPVQPVLEFQMLDQRFVDAAEVIGSMSDKMNLMDLDYNEFEDLVTGLFNSMGYNSIGTRRSRDGGVDSIVYHHDPVFGGKVIVQAKRYRDKIGPGHVRELIGTLAIEKASKAILVTTSDFTDDSRTLKADYENIELINGNNLLHLLHQHAGVEARIDL